MIDLLIALQSVDWRKAGLEGFGPGRLYRTAVAAMDRSDDPHDPANTSVAGDGENPHLARSTHAAGASGDHCSR